MPVMLTSSGPWPSTSARWEAAGLTGMLAHPWPEGDGDRLDNLLDEASRRDLSAQHARCGLDCFERHH